jgi:hypothetical protein
MNISELEKKIFMTYLRNPQAYVPEEYLSWLPEKDYVDGTKITNKRASDSLDAPGRFLILSHGLGKEADAIPLMTFVEDPMEHSCTLVHNKVYFQQHAENKEAYYKNQYDEAGPIFCKQVVKEAIDNENNHYCFISKSSSSLKYITPTNPPVRERVGYYLSSLGIFRETEDFYKKIEIVPYFGEKLRVYLERGEWSIEDKSVWARAIIEAYLIQVSDKGLVHTDINPNNICVEDRLEKKLTFIDFEESFIWEEQAPNGLGSPGYLAPEFFKEPSDCFRQLEIREQGPRGWAAALKTDYRSLFSISSDIWALGALLLEDVALDESSAYYDLAVSMRNPEPLLRPGAGELRQALVSTLLSPNGYR